MAEFKPAWYQRNGVLAAAALGIALAVHLIFAMTVRHVPNRPAPERSARTRITLLTPHALGPKEWRRLCRWVSENDPAITADPASAYSYSALRPMVRPQRKAQNVDWLDFHEPLPPLPVAVPLVNARVRHPAVEELARRSRSLPDRSGRSTELFSAFDEAMHPVKLPVLEELAQRERQKGWRPGTVKLQPARIVWRGRIPELESSCGAPELDQLALMSLTAFRRRPAGFRRLHLYWHWPVPAGGKEKP